MVFSCVKLADHASYPWFISADHYEQVLWVETQMGQVHYDLNVGQPLDSRAYFILAFDYENAVRL